MADIVSEIDAIFGGEQIPADETGCLRSAAQLLDGLDPTLLFIADGTGALVAVDDSGSQCDPAQAPVLAARIAQGLTGERLFLVEHPTESGPKLCFGLHIPADRSDGILGGLLAATDSAGRQLENLYPAMVVCGSLIWFGIRTEKQAAEHKRRVQHLLAEQDTLKVSHAHTVATVIEEREERIRQQRDYVIHLEEEVQKRSAALRKAMHKAQAANEAKSRFLANMSHEIRTPMTAILGYADVLFESGDLQRAPPHRIEAIRTIRRNGTHLLEVINDILDMAKVEAGKLAVEPVPCSPVDILDDVLALMRSRADEKHLPLGMENIGPIPERIRTDPTRLRQILVNLVSNAIKFTDDGEIRVVVQLLNARCESQIADSQWETAGPESETGHAPSPVLQFDIIDTGIGMSGPQMRSLFQPFTQVDTSASRRFGGTGLGLTISRRFAKMLGGDVVVVDSRPGGGSRFRATINTGPLAGVKMVDRIAPCRKPDPCAELHPKSETANAPSRDPQPEIHALEGCRILLAEDSPDNRRLVSHFLERVGADVFAVENGRLAVYEALTARQRGEPFDVILMDMQMPVMDGFEATGTLRREGYTGAIIAITAHTMAGDRERCLKAGCSDYATKPIDRTELVKTINTHRPNGTS